MATSTLLFSETFEFLWGVLKRDRFGGQFEYAETSKSFRSVVSAHFKTVAQKPRYGVYVIRVKSISQVVYIGKGGTVTNASKFKDQDVPGRLKAHRGRVSSDKWFKMLCDWKGPLTIEYVFLGAMSISPAAAEVTLLQAYLNEHGSLPEMNRTL